MRKDINFLETSKQGGETKQSNSMVILVVVMLLILGIVAFVFFNTKGKLDKINADITGFENDKKTYAPKNEVQKNMLVEAQGQLQAYLKDLLSKDVIENKLDTVERVASDTVSSIAEQRVIDGTVQIKISEFKLVEGDNSMIELTCRTNDGTEYLQSIEYMQTFEKQIKDLVVLDDNAKPIVTVSKTKILKYVEDVGAGSVEFVMQIALNIDTNAEVI